MASLRTSFAQRLSSASLLTLSSIDTVLPQYSAVDNNEKMDAPPAFEEPDQLSSDLADQGSSPVSDVWNSQSTSPIVSNADIPSQDNIANPHHSILLTSTMIEVGDPNTPFASRSQPDFSQFQYSYPIRSGNPWATLQLYTRDSVPGNPKPSRVQPKVPQIWSCDSLKGVIQLDVGSPQIIQHISIMLRGKIATSSMDGGSLQFMTHEFTLWKRSFGDPNANDSSSKEIFNGKFVGKYALPFSFPFPTHVDPSTKSVVVPTIGSPQSEPNTAASPLSSPSTEEGKGKKKQRFSWPLHFASPFGSSDACGNASSSKRKSTFRPQSGRFGCRSVASPLPQTFAERGVTAIVAYEVSVLFVHGRFRPDSRIKTSVSYVPALQPFPASLKRRQAYEAAALIPNPSSDPDGWFPLAEVPIIGLFDGQDIVGKRRTKVNCKLYLAEPLSYTRGATIPCFLSLASDDAEALQWLASPKVPVVRLMRHVHHFVPRVNDPYEENPGMELLPSNAHPAAMFVPGTAAIGESVDLKIVSHEVATAIWWPPSKDVSQGTFMRHLEGEVHLSADLQPSCACEIFRVEYVVELLSLQSAYFEVEPDIDPGSFGKTRSRSGFASAPVEVTTLYRQDEPIPVPFSEPPKVRMRRLPSNDTVLEQPENE